MFCLAGAPGRWMACTSTHQALAVDCALKRPLLHCSAIMPAAGVQQLGATGQQCQERALWVNASKARQHRHRGRS